ncbi:YheC/YheD family protein [Alicyclobacillus tolerans]|uniref:YheC/YheD family endospore coat-associated protein n=1 Tax=Alicyclobacillus tolerans TaxID=90970 RepID=UPI001F2EBA68|nr:YheC/YheD family protein [Alicyclobacillus tolerans]MCF8564836.1 YheC/YheD family protein [Alicyclobacillus tolerans]
MQGDGEYQLSTFQSSQALIRVHPSLGTQMALRRGQRCWFVCGAQMVEVPVVFDDTVPNDFVFCSTSLIERVQAMDLDVQSARVTQDVIAVSPRIGILSNPVWNEKQGKLRRTKQLPALEKLVQAGERQGALCFIFRLQDVDFQTLRVKGYRFLNQRWEPVVLPLPDAVYDQVISRKLERSPEYAKKRTKLTKLFGNRLFNSGFFDKWQVYQWLSTDVRTKKHVPATIRYTRLREAASFVQRYPTSFLKPVHGSLGLGIVRLTRLQDGTFLYEVKRSNQGPAHGKVQNAEEAVKAFKSRLIARPYLLQQGIPLKTQKGRPFDIRILLQRDSTGEWKRTKMFARIARQGDFTSNLSSGGEALAVATVLGEIYASSEQRKRITRDIRRISRTAVEVMEQQAGTQFGELGLDLGIDEMGHVWIIEVNSKPWKSPTTEKGRQDLVDLAFARPMQYAIRLAQHK